MSLEDLWNLSMSTWAGIDGFKVIWPLRRIKLTMCFFQARFEVRKAHAKVRASAKA